MAKTVVFTNVEELLGAYELSLSPVNTLFNILKKFKHIIKK